MTIVGIHLNEINNYFKARIEAKNKEEKSKVYPNIFFKTDSERKYKLMIEFKDMIEFMSRCKTTEIILDLTLSEDLKLDKNDLFHFVSEYIYT